MTSSIRVLRLDNMDNWDNLMITAERPTRPGVGPARLAVRSGDASGLDASHSRARRHSSHPTGALDPDGQTPPQLQTRQIVGGPVADDIPGGRHRSMAAGKPLSALRVEDLGADPVAGRRNVGHKRLSRPSAGDIMGAEHLSGIDTRHRSDHVVEELLDGGHLDPAGVDPPPGRIAEHRPYAD